MQLVTADRVLAEKAAPAAHVERQQASAGDRGDMAAEGGALFDYYK
jgi:hypothetical protein